MIQSGAACHSALDAPARCALSGSFLRVVPNLLRRLLPALPVRAAPSSPSHLSCSGLHPLSLCLLLPLFAPDDLALVRSRLMICLSLVLFLLLLPSPPPCAVPDTPVRGAPSPDAPVPGFWSTAPRMLQSRGAGCLQSWSSLDASARGPVVCFLGSSSPRMLQCRGFLLGPLPQLIHSGLAFHSALDAPVRGELSGSLSRLAVCCCYVSFVLCPVVSVWESRSFVPIPPLVSCLGLHLLPNVAVLDLDLDLVCPG